HLNDIKLSSIRDNLLVNDVYVNGTNAYLSTSIGIFAIDLNRKEISGTYIIGENGERISVFNSVVQNEKIYAATVEGIKSADLTGTNLQDFRSWIVELNSPVNRLFANNTSLYFLRNDSLFRKEGNNWNYFYSDSKEIRSISADNQNLVLTRNNSIDIISSSGVLIRSVQNNSTPLNPSDVLIIDEEIWIADQNQGLLKFDGSSFTGYSPQSPAGVSSGQVISTSNGIYTVAGIGKSAGLYQFKDRSWINITSSNTLAFRNVSDLNSVVYDFQKNETWVGSFEDGLIRITSNGEIEQFKESSFISPALNNNTSYRVKGLAIDLNNVLWISNHGASNPLVARDAEGNIFKFSLPFNIPNNTLGKIIIDDIGQKWIIAEGVGLICFSDNNTVSNPADDQWRLYTAGQGNGNLPVNMVLDITKDKNNFIWIGTTSGIGIIQCTELVFTSQGCEAILPVVQQGNFAGYLFRGEEVLSIEVDGGTKKWIGTKNGVWLISEDGEKTIERFTIDNSPLPDNNIIGIAIDDLSGEVFLNTARGIVSFRGTATSFIEGNNPVNVFPNPVPPGFAGTIAIRGVPENSIIKITELDGRLVYQGRSQGTQFTWNGRDYNGRKISSGVYLVLAKEGVSGEKLVTKIVYINK
ncbi:MAG: type IX secretion system anionic LPS delivery protein PorZ, partial [Flavitalea sp.]